MLRRVSFLFLVFFPLAIQASIFDFFRGGGGRDDWKVVDAIPRSDAPATKPPPTTTTLDTRPPVWREIVQAKVFNPTSPPVYQCSKGLIGAVAWSLGTSLQELGPIGDLLGGLGGLGRRRLEEAEVEGETTTKAEQCVEPERIRRIRDTSIYKMSVSDVYDLLDYAQHTTATPVTYSVPNERTPKVEMQAAPFGTREAGRDIVNGLKFMMAGLAKMTAGSLESQSSDEASFEFNHSNIESTLRVLKEAAPLRKLGLDLSALPVPVLGFLASKTFARFMMDMIYVRLSGFSLSLTSPNINLATVSCGTFDYTREYDILSQKRVCILLNIISAVLACRNADFDKSSCSGLLQEDFHNDPVGAPVILTPVAGTRLAGQTVDLSKPFSFGFKNLLEGGVELPAVIPEDVVLYESVDMFVLFRAAHIAYNYAKLAYPCGIQSPPKALIPGYKTDLIIDSLQEGDAFLVQANITGIPFILFNREEGGCGLVIVIRQTATQFDWRMDMTTNLIPFIKPGIVAHAGFAQMIHAMYGPIDEYFAKYLDDCPPIRGQKREVIVAGHSLGAGVGAMLSLFLADRYIDSVRVTAALIAAPNTFNQAGVDYYAKIVNGRAVGIDLDPISVVPCKNKLGWPRCNEEMGLVYTGEGVDDYGVTKGRFVIEYLKEFTEKDYPHTLHGDVFATIDAGSVITIKLKVPPALQIPVSHNCGYGCFYSRKMSSDKADEWMCSNNTCSGYLLPNGLETSISL